MNNGKRVWVIEKDKYTLQGLRLNLIGAGYNVTPFASGKAALSAARELGEGFKDTVDLVMFDASSSDVSGEKLVAGLRRKRWEPQVMAFNFRSRGRGVGAKPRLPRGRTAVDPIHMLGKVADILEVDDINEGREERMIRVLVVDGDPDHSYFMVRFLEGHGFRVDTVDDGLKAYGFVKFLEEKGQELDLIISDIELANLSGLELMDRLKKDKIKIPIVLMSFENDEQTIVAALRHGCSEVVRKPFQEGQIIKTIEKAISTPTPFFFDPSAR